MSAINIDNCDTTTCEQEPIRFPGAVQPHGALLVLQPVTGIIEAASASCQAILGRSAESLLGQHLETILDPASSANLLTAQSDDLHQVVHVRVGGKDMPARLGINEAGQVLLEIEPPEHSTFLTRRTIYRCRRGLGELRQMSDVAAIAQKSVTMIRDIIGYDRVMIYRFDAEWNGEIIAEARIDSAEPFLGLNFPASDIPKLARELFQACKVRIIPDIHYTPSDLVARGDNRAIDLGLAGLRSVSPIHIEYCSNLGVRATLVGALVVAGRLWGLVACHHYREPKHFGPDERDALGWLFEDIAALIGTTLTSQLRSREQFLAIRRRKLVDVIRQVDVKALLREGQTADLLDVVGADGFALLLDGSIHRAGSTPAVERIRQLQERRRERETDPTLFASNALSRDLDLADAGDGVAGALFVSVLDKPNVTMIWFRNERRHAVHWAGNPDHPHLVDERGRVSPRKSFAQFLRNVEGQSLAWAPEELHSAAELGSLIEIEALRQREAFNQTILDSMPEHVSVLNPQGVIKTVNNAWIRFAERNGAKGATANPVGLNYRDICAAAEGYPSGEEAGAAWVGIEAVLQKRLDHFKLDYPCDSPTERRWFQMSVSPMLTPAEGVLVAHENVTARKLAEEKLEQVLREQQAILDSRIIGIVKIRDGKITWANPVFAEGAGYALDELIGQPTRIAYPSDQAYADLVKAAYPVIGRGEIFHTESQLRRKDGSLGWYKISGALLGPESAESIWAFVDVTDARLANAERDRLLKIIEESPDFIATSDMHGHLKYMNRAGARVVGIAEDVDLSALEIKDVHPAWATRRVLDEGVPTVLTQGFWECETALLHRDGHEIPVLQLLMLHRDASGNPEYLSTIMNDMSERKKAEAELKQHRHHLEVLVEERTLELTAAKEAAEAANRAKTVFLATMSHELRTPLNAIMGMTELAQRRVTDPKQGEQLNKVMTGANNLLGIVKDILDISRIEADRVRLQNAEFSLDHVLETVTNAFAAKAAEKHLDLVIDIDPELAVQSIKGDRLRLGQVLLNLTGNAIKFTAQGSVAVRVSLIEAQSRDVLLRFEVQDTGIGIAGVDQQRIFKVFEQADGSTTRKFGGTGLGLTICKRLVELMGSEIHVDSQVGLGSTFWFVLCFGKVANVLPAAPVLAALTARRQLKECHQGAYILVAEDDPFNQEVAQELLEEAGLVVHVAENGAVAVAMAKRTNYDLILMDVQMPVMDGLEATRRIRKSSHHPDVPIIALTANVFPEDEARCRDAGMNDFIGRPVESEALFRKLLKWMEKTG